MLWVFEIGVWSSSVLQGKEFLCLDRKSVHQFQELVWFLLRGSVRVCVDIHP
jgi:hypothetical protein